jgi:hypothetical protein
MKHLSPAVSLGALASVAWALSNSISSGQAPPLVNGLAVALAVVALILVGSAWADGTKPARVTSRTSRTTTLPS